MQVELPCIMCVGQGEGEGVISGTLKIDDRATVSAAFTTCKM